RAGPAPLQPNEIQFGAVPAAVAWADAAARRQAAARNGKDAGQEARPHPARAERSRALGRWRRASRRRGVDIIAPIHGSVASCSTPSRRGLEPPSHAAPKVQRPALTASRHEAIGKSRVGTKKRAFKSNKEPAHFFHFLGSPEGPFLRPALRLSRRRAQAPSRLAVAHGPPHAPVSPGHALTATSTASCWAAVGFATFLNCSVTSAAPR